ncbi:glycoside hydrolase family 2 TIM barrel-domain containing protein [Desertivirga xinjiangensis]|uniref:glycoside hydrolase family 2 TIM barrel-domain containing protein n=1 Tax=Desertivirga xinjiangensis TaxID=539206 RepID=UPI00210EFBBB|nr:glycoside hydrolase family 2 TIM barrel-domain containing protein [Pedobacter xinjiangensis]
MILKFLAGLLLVNLTLNSYSQSQPARIQWSANDSWRFLPQGADFVHRPKIDDGKWELVRLPHTWNAFDPFDDDEISRRGISWYRKKLVLDNRFKGKNLYLYFEGAYQVADVYVNGVFAGQHKGGYTAFCFDITKLIKLGDKPVENLIAVQLNNAQDNFIPPLSIGYASYGGIYRDVWLLATNKIHFKTLDHASKGIYISTPEVSEKTAQVKIRSILSNDTEVEKKVELIHQIYDANQKEIAKLREEVRIPAGGEIEVSMLSSRINEPLLWSPDHPNLYKVKSRITEKGQVTDELINPLGFRWFSFDPDKGFSLNGKRLQLKGTNRHQDFKERGDALSDEDHYRDLKLIKDMGCNFLRLAHYPQDPEVLRLADEMGLLIWEEIPLVNYMNPVPEFLQNSANMIREMIRQNYNHPSVIIWGSMNEVLLWSDMAERIQVQTNAEYLKKVRTYALHLDSIVRAEDPLRYSTMAMHMSDDYDRYKLSGIPAISAYNIYDGWYSNVVEDFGKAMDEKHRVNPKQVLFISEYGAEADNRVNSENPVRFDFTGQYQRYYHESYLSQINQRPYLAGTAIWNEFDFSQPNVGGVSNNMNQKGMITWDRKPKDSYYLYKANWNPQPMVYVASRDWQDRAGQAGSKSTIEVYSNLNEVTLTVDGESFGTKSPDAIKKCIWKVALREGANIVHVSGKVGNTVVSDQLVINYHTYSLNLKDPHAPFRGIFINAGSNSQYLDQAKNIWIEDRPYQKGSFGYIGGAPATLNIKTVKKNTEDMPLFYSYHNDIKAYRLDVPNGQYEVELCFIENDKIAGGERIFDVAINGDKVLQNLDLSSECGFAVALKKKYMITADKGEGINVTFEAKKGKAILSGIKVKAK